MVAVIDDWKGENKGTEMVSYRNQMGEEHYFTSIITRLLYVVRPVYKHYCVLFSIFLFQIIEIWIWSLKLKVHVFQHNT